MKREKSVLLMVIFLAIVFGLVLSVNAGWWNTITGKATGSTKVNVSVNAPTIPGNITFVSKAFRTSDGSSTLNQGPQTTDFIFSFIANHSAGNVNLPGINVGDEVSTFIISNFTNGSLYRPDTTCYLKNIFGSGPGSTKNYTCNITMQFFDNWGTNNWLISVQIRNKDNVVWSAVNNTQKFNVNALVAFSIPANSAINFTGVTMGSTFNRPSDNNISIVNNGNTDLTSSTFITQDSYLTLNATNLSMPPTDIFPAIDFAAGESATPCTTQMNDSRPVNVSFSLLHTNSAVNSPVSKNLSLCILNTNGVLNSGSYGSVTEWVLETKTNP